MTAVPPSTARPGPQPSRSATPISLLRDHVQLVQRLAGHWFDAPEEAEDAAQEALVNLLEALPGFRGQCALSTWIYRITLTTCRGRGRRRQQRRAREAPLDHEPAGVELAADERLAEVERHGAVRAAVDGLPEDYRAVVVLHYLQGLSHEQTAEVLAVPLGTVKVRLHRARARLRRLLPAE